MIFLTNLFVAVCKIDMTHRDTSQSKSIHASTGWEVTYLISPLDGATRVQL